MPAVVLVRGLRNFMGFLPISRVCVRQSFGAPPCRIGDAGHIVGTRTPRGRHLQVGPATSAGYRRCVPRLLIVHHSPTPTSVADRRGRRRRPRRRDRRRRGRGAAGAGGHHRGRAGRRRLLLGTPANFGYMSGPSSTSSTASSSTSAGRCPTTARRRGGTVPEEAVRALRARPLRHHRRRAVGPSITGALPWRQVAQTLEVLGDVGSRSCRRPTSSAGPSRRC